MGKARAAGCISAVATSHTQRRALSRFGPTFRREVRPAKPRVLEAKAAANSCRRLASRSNGQRQPCGRTAAASARERPAATGRARRTGCFERGARPRRRATGGDEHATTIQPRAKSPSAAPQTRPQPAATIPAAGAPYRRPINANSLRLPPPGSVPRKPAAPGTAASEEVRRLPQ